MSKTKKDAVAIGAREFVIQTTFVNEIFYYQHCRAEILEALIHNQFLNFKLNLFTFQS